MLHFHALANEIGVRKFLVWYDRDQAGNEGAKKDIDLLKQEGFVGQYFNWDMRFQFGDKVKGIPEQITDVIDNFLLNWLLRIVPNPKMETEIKPFKELKPT